MKHFCKGTDTEQSEHRHGIHLCSFIKQTLNNYWLWLFLFSGTMCVLYWPKVCCILKCTHLHWVIYSNLNSNKLWTIGFWIHRRYGDVEQNWEARVMVGVIICSVVQRGSAWYLYRSLCVTGQCRKNILQSIFFSLAKIKFTLLLWKMNMVQKLCLEIISFTITTQ